MNKKNYTSPEVEKISLDDDVLEYVTGGTGIGDESDNGSDNTNVGMGRGGEGDCFAYHRDGRNFSKGRGSNCV